jgi:hypothetical protein
MASTTISTISALGGKLVVDLAVGSNDQTVNNNATAATSGSIYLVEIDNPNSTSFFLKIRDNASATPSTSAANGAGTPNLMLYCPARQNVSYAIPGGFAYSAGVSFWGTTSATVGTVTAPTNSVVVKLVCS